VRSGGECPDELAAEIHVYELAHLDDAHGGAGEALAPV
jgi:hypothetical protein